MRVDLLGTAFTIRSDEDPEYLSEVVEHFRTKVEEVRNGGTTSDPLKTAILAGLLATDEYLKLNGATRRSNTQVGQIAEVLIGELDEALDNPPSN